MMIEKISLYIHTFASSRETSMPKSPILKGSIAAQSCLKQEALPLRHSSVPTRTGRFRSSGACKVPCWACRSSVSGANGLCVSISNPWRPSKEYEIPIGGSGAHVSVAAFTPDGPSKRDYTTTIHIAPNAVVPGIYKMVVAVTYELSPGVPGPIAGFHEGGMLQLL